MATTGDPGPSIRDDLLTAWDALSADLGLDPAPARALGEDLLARWAEPHRTYHDLRHLAAVLDALAELVGDPAPSPEVRAAAWFHDAVYAGRAGEDEEASATLAEGTLVAAGLGADSARRIGEMVRATAGHVDPSGGRHRDDETAQLLDADLSILAADRARYDAYAAGVRAEHPDVDDAAFAAGRAAVLRTLLGRDELFRTERGRRRYDDAARANLRRELADLSRTAGPG